jgi:TolC family type I secretion outer membrane protein
MMPMARTVASLLLMMVLLPAAAAADDTIRAGETLTLERCLAIALSRHPDLQAAAHTVRAGESRIGQARAGYYPRLSGAAGYSRSDPSGAGGAAGRFSNPSDSYSSSLSLSQNLYDFGKTATQVRIRELDRDSSQADFEQVRAQIVLGVKQAYWELLKSERDREVAREAVGQFQQHLDRAKGFFDVGTKPKFDVTKAEVDLSGAKLALLKAENAWRLARVSLSNAIGLPEAPEFAIVDSLSATRAPVALDEGIRLAYDRRPEIRALTVRVQAQAETVNLVKKDNYPFLTGNASYGWGGGDFPLDDGWSVGAQVNVPLFSGYATKYQIEEARATLDALNASLAALRQAVSLEVKQAWLNLREASDRIDTAALSVRQAEENLELAQGRYATGVGSPIEVTDALVAVSNAKTAHTAALYDYRVAQASLEKATGER